jgi:hypothetical protein
MDWRTSNLRKLEIVWDKAKGFVMFHKGFGKIIKPVHKCPILYLPPLQAGVYFHSHKYENIFIENFLQISFTLKRKKGS